MRAHGEQGRSTVEFSRTLHKLLDDASVALMYTIETADGQYDIGENFVCRMDVLNNLHVILNGLWFRQKLFGVESRLRFHGGLVLPGRLTRLSRI